MTTQYTPVLRVALPVTGELTGTWGEVTNDSITLLFEQAIVGVANINTWTSNTHVLTVANGAPSESRCAVLVAAAGGGAPTAAATIVCPAVPKLYVLRNTTVYPVTLQTPSGLGTAVPAGQSKFLFCNGTDVVSVETVVANATTADKLTTARLINGTSFDGTAGITTANWGTSRTLTIGSTGKAVDGSAGVTWTLGEIGAQPVDGDLTAIAGLTGTSGLLRKTAADTWELDTNAYGSVTSVGVTVPTGFSASGTPVTTSGTIAISFAAGYALPTTTKQGEWDTAYTDRLKWDGGSSSLDASAGRTSLGATTIGGNLFTLADPGAIRFPRFNADNTVSSLSDSDFRTAIGATTIGSSLFTLANPGAITFPRFNANNTVSSLSASDFRTAIGAGTGSVTSVGVSVPTGFSASGTPVTTSGTIAISFAAGYALPTTTKQSEWDTAYTDRLKWDGGSSSLDASAGRTSLGATTIGGNLFTLADPGAITFPRFNADNTVSSLSASDFRAAIGVGTGAGTVTSVGVSVPTGFSVADSPVTTSGTIAISFAAGYALPTTTKQSEWDTAYTDRLKWDGGSSGLTASTGRTSLGATTIGGNLFTLANPGAITFPRFNANNTVSSLSASDFRAAIGATTVGGNLFTLANPGAVRYLQTNADNTVTAITAATLLTDIAALPLAGGTLTGKLVLKGVRETVHALSGSSVTPNPDNGTVQTWSLSANSTVSGAGMLTGESLTLMVAGNGYTITWPTMQWMTNGGSAPTLNTTGYTAIQLWKVGTDLYGARVGDA